MIYLDITTTKKYCGLNPVGIVRCEIESLNYILAHEELPAKFCYFSKAENKFIVIGRDEAAKIISLVGSPKADFPPANNTQQNIPVSGESSPPMRNPNQESVYKKFKKTMRRSVSHFIEKTYDKETASRIKQIIIDLINHNKIAWRSTRQLTRDMFAFNSKKQYF